MPGSTPCHSPALISPTPLLKAAHTLYYSTVISCASGRRKLFLLQWVLSSKIRIILRLKNILFSPVTWLSHLLVRLILGIIEIVGQRTQSDGGDSGAVAETF